MIHSVQLIILATTKVGEKNIVLHCLTQQWGRRSFITTVSKSSGMALWQPLNILEAEVMENPRSDLWRLRSASASYPLGGIRSSVVKTSMTLFMSEVLYRTIKDEAREDGLFEWCRSSILTLDALQADFSNFHLRWLLEFAGALGFSPSPEGLAPFAGERLQDIRKLLSSSFAECMVLPLDGRRRNEIAEILLQYLGYHTESRIEARSLRVLRELFE